MQFQELVSKFITTNSGIYRVKYIIYKIGKKHITQNIYLKFINYFQQDHCKQSTIIASILQLITTALTLIKKCFNTVKCIYDLLTACYNVSLNNISI